MKSTPGITFVQLTYQTSICEVDVMWRLVIVIGLSDLTGGVMSTITGLDVTTVSLLAKSMAEKIYVKTL